MHADHDAEMTRKVFENQIKVAEQKKCCPLCTRTFNPEDEINATSFVEELKKMMARQRKGGGDKVAAEKEIEVIFERSTLCSNLHSVFQHLLVPKRAHEWLRWATSDSAAAGVSSGFEVAEGGDGERKVQV